MITPSLDARIAQVIQAIRYRAEVCRLSTHGLDQRKADLLEARAESFEQDADELESALAQEVQSVAQRTVSPLPQEDNAYNLGFLAGVKHQYEQPMIAPPALSDQIAALIKRVESIRGCANRKQTPCRCCDRQLLALVSDLKALAKGVQSSNEPSLSARIEQLIVKWVARREHQYEPDASPEYVVGLMEEFEADLKALAQGVQPVSGEWQLIETAPKDGTHFIAYTSCGVMLFTAHWNITEQKWFTDYERWGGSMTHWMPLPTSPAPRELSPI